MSNIFVASYLSNICIIWSNLIPFVYRVHKHGMVTSLGLVLCSWNSWIVCTIIGNNQLKHCTIPHICHFFYRQDFWKPNFTPKKTTKGTKNTKNVSEKSQIYAFFSLNLEKFTPDRKFLHSHRLWCLWQIWGMASCIISELIKYFWQYAKTVWQN